MKKQKRNYKTTTSNTEVSTLIKILIGVLIFLGFTYLITGLLTGEIKLGKKDKDIVTEAEIQYEEILAGETLNRTETDYYVMYFNFTDNIASSYITLKDTYLKKEKALGFYLVDLEKGFNKGFVAQNDENTDKINFNNISELKVKNPTILKISNHKVVERVEGKDKIISFLEEINK